MLEKFTSKVNHQFTNVRMTNTVNLILHLTILLKTLKFECIIAPKLF